MSWEQTVDNGVSTTYTVKVKETGTLCDRLLSNGMMGRSEASARMRGSPGAIAGLRFAAAERAIALRPLAALVAGEPRMRRQYHSVVLQKPFTGHGRIAVEFVVDYILGGSSYGLLSQPLFARNI